MRSLCGSNVLSMVQSFFKLPLLEHQLLQLTCGNGYEFGNAGPALVLKVRGALSQLFYQIGAHKLWSDVSFDFKYQPMITVPLAG
jgi:hypothetical protein